MVSSEAAEVVQQELHEVDSKSSECSLAGFYKALYVREDTELFAGHCGILMRGHSLRSEGTVAEPEA